MLNESTETIRGQVDEEGREWGLVGRTHRGRVKLCRLDYVAEVRGGFCNVEEDEPFALCTIDEEHVFSDALVCRVRDGEVDPAARYALHDELVAKEQAKQEAEVDQQWWAAWNARKRGITMLPGGLTAPGYEERKERRLNQIMRGGR